ncbi:MAG: GGDEF domain-containing response regulator [Candidatus Humimicrobiaceae bacterium]
MKIQNKANRMPLILIVDDTPKNIQLLGSVLREENYKIAIANNGAQAVSIASQIRPDLILLDVMMPGLNGFETCQKIKEIEEIKKIPIIFLTAKSEIEEIVNGFKVGAVDYITKPFNIYELKARVKTHIELKISKDLLEESNIKLEKLSITDGLTGLYNHRYIVDLTSRLIEEAKRYKQILSVSMIDIDNFKSINDTYGHPFGNEVLIKLASTFEEKVRKTDYAGRYGGEEFLIVLEHTDISGAIDVIERIRSSVENLKWQKKDLKITISSGVFQRTDEDTSLLISKADQLLLKAKKNGKNRVES